MKEELDAKDAEIRELREALGLITVYASLDVSAPCVVRCQELLNIRAMAQEALARPTPTPDASDEREAFEKWRTAYKGMQQAASYDSANPFEAAQWEAWKARANASPAVATLPYEVNVGGMTFGKGVKLETLVNAAKRWKAQAANAFTPQVAGDVEDWSDFTSDQPDYWSHFKEFHARCGYDNTPESIINANHLHSGYKKGWEDHATLTRKGSNDGQ